MPEKIKINGVTTIFEKMPEMKTVSVGIWVKAGSIYEDEGINGVSHFIEHMLFKGTKNMTCRQIAEKTDDIGAEINAYTEKDCTCYYATVLDVHQLAALNILLDMLCNPLFSQEDTEKEREVIIEEILSSLDDPEDVCSQSASSIYFKETPLERQVLGTLKSVKNIDENILKNYYFKRYTAENTVIVAAGNIDEEKITALLREKLTLNGKKEEKETIVKPHGICEVRFIKRNIKQAHLCLCFPAYSLQDERKYAMAQFSNILGGNMSSRLFQKIREEEGLCYSVYSYDSLYKAAGMLSVYAAFNMKNAKKTIRLIKNEISKIRRDGVSEKELMRSAEQLKSALVLSYETPAQRMEAIGRNVILTGEIQDERKMLKAINAVSTEDVYKAAQLIDEEKLCGAVVGKNVRKNMFI